MLAGEKPIMPAPPNVWLEESKAEELLLEVLVPLVPDVPVVVVVPVVVEPPGPVELPEPKREVPPKLDPPILEPIDDPPSPLPPLGPTPASTEPPAEPAPAIGWPKKPSD